jgi:hypothetical protein
MKRADQNSAYETKHTIKRGRPSKRNDVCCCKGGGRMAACKDNVPRKEFDRAFCWRSGIEVCEFEN